MNARWLVGLVSIVFGCTGVLGGGDDDPLGQNGAACRGDDAFFKTQIWEPILAVQCVGCHNAEGPAKHTRLVLAPPSDPDAWKKNYPVVRALADERLGDHSPLLLRPTGKHPEGHGGGALIAEDSPAYAALATFVRRGEGRCSDAEGATCTEATVALGRRKLRRLGRAEYDATIADLLGIPSKWGETLPADGVVNGFDNNASALRVSALFADKARVAAEEIADTVDVAKLSSCADDACAAKFVASFGERAFRRPLTETELARYRTLYGSAGGVAPGLRLVITAMLQSPSFLYRSELGVAAGGKVALTPWELASELSYFLWGTMPDAALFEKARSGALADPKVLAQEARRLLHSPRAEKALERFFGQWLEIDRLPHAAKDAATFPAFTPEVRAAMRAETLRFAADVVRTGTFEDLLTATSKAPPPLAAFYGEEGRAGVLAHGSVLATHATPLESSPVHRGKLVRERFFCQKLAPPPPGLVVQLPPFDPKQSTRERFAAHSKNQPCVGCHRLMDPIGFGFEAFDAVGKKRNDDHGHPLDTQGEIVATAATDGPFEGLAALERKLASSPDVHACFALQWWRFAQGTEESAEESCGVRLLAKKLAGRGLKLEELIVAIVEADGFRFRVDDGKASPPPSTSTEASDAGPSAPAGDAAPPPPPSKGVTVSSKTDSSWPTGRCDTVVVKNESSEKVDWVVRLASDGKITTKWNALVVVEGGDFVFTGDVFNKTLAPAASTSFGYCVDTSK